MDNDQHLFTLKAKNVQTLLVRLLQLFERRNCTVISVKTEPLTHGNTHVLIEASNVPDPEQMCRYMEKLVDVYWAKIV